MNITTEQIKVIHGRMPDHVKHDRELKQMMVSQFTGNPEMSSTRDLTYSQANELIKHLGGRPIDMRTWAIFDPGNQQHKYILSLCYQLGWIEYNEKSGRNVPDLNRLGAWLKKYGYLHKRLKAYTAVELPKLVTQFEMLLK
ncbi:MAG: hypothetical protein H6606_05945 [Flavobacteriales bacterium]|nr:hypothetical protein [Flavobacteriales bacterium]